MTANAKATITTQGTISGSSVATNMAITGDGFFSIQKATGVVDNAPVFSGVTYYTRRGDFQLNANGNLVNGAGYYLMGVTVDPKTGNPTGNVRDSPEIPEQLHPGAGDHLDPVRREPAERPNTVASSTAASGTLLAAGGLNPSDFAANPLPVGTPPPPYANARRPALPQPAICARPYRRRRRPARWRCRTTLRRSQLAATFSR